MILLAFLSCLLVFFFVKDKIPPFQLKQIIVFLNQVFRVCVHFIAGLRPSLIIEFSTPGSRVVLYAVDSWNIKHELRSKKIKQFCIMQTFPNDISRFAVFYFLHELKQRSGSSDVTGRH